MAAASSLLEKPTIRVSLAQPENFAVAWQLLEEYFDSVQVIVRDDQETVLSHLSDPGSKLWLAYCADQPAGCIALRPLAGKLSADHPGGEIKRLYVRPKFRRLGIASSLLSALESHAIASGISRLFLDSKDDLKEALVFYVRSGYRMCERYNDNPQATLFMTKHLSSPFSVREFCAGDEDAFRSLNEAWISKLFKLEPKDVETLQQPQKYILSKGGRIYMACRGAERVGCCALLKIGDGNYELAKMGVAESERGRGVGRALLVYVIQDAKRLGYRRLYLETNHSLENAIHLYESIGFRHLNPDQVTRSPYARADVFMDMILN